MDLLWEGVKKAFELLWTLDPEVLGITAPLPEGLHPGHPHQPGAGRRRRHGHRPDPVPRQAPGHRRHQYGHGPAPGGGGPVRHHPALAQRALRLPGHPVHAHGHHRRPDHHRHAHHRRHLPGGHPAAAPGPAPADPGPGGHPLADAGPAGPGGAPAAHGRGDGRLRRRDLGGGGVHHGGRQHQGQHPGAHHRHGHGDRQGQLRHRHRPEPDPHGAHLLGERRCSPTSSSGTGPGERRPAAAEAPATAPALEVPGSPCTGAASRSWTSPSWPCGPARCWPSSAPTARARPPCSRPWPACWSRPPASLRFQGRALGSRLDREAYRQAGDHGVPGAAAVRHHRGPQPGVRAEAARRSRPASAGARVLEAARALRHRAPAGPPGPQALRRRGPARPAWPGPSSCGRRSCSWTSPSRPWTRPPGRRLLDDLGAALRQTGTTAVLATHDQRRPCAWRTPWR